MCTLWSRKYSNTYSREPASRTERQGLDVELEYTRCNPGVRGLTALQAVCTWEGLFASQQSQAANITGIHFE